MGRTAYCGMPRGGCNFAVMSLRMEDGTKGRRFVARCDGCGEEVIAGTFQEREDERVRLGWTPTGRDLCSTCQRERVLEDEPLTRPRFASRNRYA